MNCGQSITVKLREYLVKVVCTDDDGHTGDHYDAVFSYAWAPVSEA